MSGLEVVLGVILTAGSIISIVKPWGSYKMNKRAIYKIIQEGVNQVDVGLIQDGFEKLKDFDNKYKDSTGKPIKSIVDRMFFKKRVPKMDKVFEKFGIPVEVAKNMEGLKTWMETADKDSMTEKLEKIDEEERTEKMKEVVAVSNIESLMAKQLMELTEQRKVVDSLNLTDTVHHIQMDILKAIKVEFEQEKDVGVLIDRLMKKNLLKQ